MPRIKYINKTFQAGSLNLIETANEIITDYAGQGYDLTLRQLYYQFVARDLLPNTVRSYKRLGSVISDARLAGLVDWSAIVDRTRNLRANPHWDNPEDIVRSAAQQFAIDRWADQSDRVEVWIEKDALLGVIEPICNALDVPFFSCRGYISQSEAWNAAIRLGRWDKAGQRTTVIHLSDHDPSGIDMSRDIAARFETFRVPVEVVRIALTMDQIEHFNPPPNPAKTTDSRAADYIAEYGPESWELDALSPDVLSGLVKKTVGEFIDQEQWSEGTERELEGRAKIERAAAIMEDEADR